MEGTMMHCVFAFDLGIWVGLGSYLLGRFIGRRLG
jgi:hypothetical protein